MIFFPYSTDAPIYHLPIATGTIILANIAIFFATTFQVLPLGNMEFEDIQWLILEFGKINPIQWITASFMHGDLMHLLGNMFFLWAFGLVIEGKVGPLVFTAVYFLITLIDGAAVQIPMFLISGESGALGASGVIFGLMMIAVIWAPENEMDCFYWFLIVFGTAEIRIIALGGIFIGLQLLFLFLGGFGMSSEMLHMVGAVIGAPIGFYMLRQDMVDCEGWDVVSRNPWMQEMNLFCTDKQRARRDQEDDSIEDPVATAIGKKPAKRARGKSPLTTSSMNRKKAVNSKRVGGKTPVNDDERFPQATKQADLASHPEFNRLSFIFRQSVEASNAASAKQTFLRMEQIKLSEGLSDRILFQYVSLLVSNKSPVEALRPLQMISSRNGPLADPARLRIAMIQTRVLHKPKLALQTLARIGETPESRPEIIQKRNLLIAEAKQQTA